MPTFDYSYDLTTGDESSKFSLTIKKLDHAELFQTIDLVDNLCERYLGTDSEPREVFPAVGGEYVPLSKTLLQGAAQIWVMQVEKIYTVEELIAFSVTCPDMWMDLMKAVGKLQTDVIKKKDQPESSLSSAVSQK